MPLRVPFLIAAAFLCAFAIACLGDDGSPEETKRPATPEEAAERWLQLWADDRFDDMWSLVATESRLTIDKQTFIDRYTLIKEEATITSID
ncbi:MAG: hypothetical protein IH863_10070, partial [Chloroflexi bacterium]|nr:hypothetical protein [Chloroflexota bacterium]